MAKRVKGQRGLSRKLSRMGTQVGGKTLRSAALGSTLSLLRQAQANAPEDERSYLKQVYTGRMVAPGFLKRNIGRKSILSADRTFVKVMVGPRAEAFYGTQFVEIGTSRQPPRPWLVPAFTATKDKVFSTFKIKLDKLIKRAAR